MDVLFLRIMCLYCTFHCNFKFFLRFLKALFFVQSILKIDRLRLNHTLKDLINYGLLRHLVQIACKLVIIIVLGYLNKIRHIDSQIIAMISGEKNLSVDDTQQWVSLLVTKISELTYLSFPVIDIELLPSAQESLLSRVFLFLQLKLVIVHGLKVNVKLL